MTMPANKSREFLMLRYQAEQLLRSQPKTVREFKENNILKLVHELEVYQTELEIQNEQLRETQEQLQAVQNQYMDLYDFAPVGYLTIDGKGLVSQANLAAAEMLGISRAYLIKNSFSAQISPEYQRLYFEARDAANQTNQRQTCQLELLLARNRQISVQMEITADRDASGQLNKWRIAVMDISQQVRAEKALRKAHEDLEDRVRERTRELVASNERLRNSEQKRRLLSDKIIAVQEAEKKRIAHELHDGVGQCLSAIKFRIECAVNHLAEGCSKEAVESCEALVPIAQQSIEEVRRMTTDLRPPMLDELGLLTTLQWLGREFRKIYPNLQLEIKIDIGESQIPDSLKIVIYRVTQESLHNVAKHAQADRAEIAVAKKMDAIELTIRDNGCGFSPEAFFSQNATAECYGLHTMKERIELSDGVFSLESSSGAGTVVKASWPCTSS